MENGVKFHMLYHEGSQSYFSCVVAAMAKTLTSATFNVYQDHLHISRKLIYVEQMRIFDY